MGKPERKATKEELKKKVNFKKVEKEGIETQEDVAKKFLESLKNNEEEDKGFDFMGLLNDPAVASIMKSGKELFKKEKTDPNVCEITIKAPSEVVLKLFKAS